MCRVFREVPYCFAMLLALEESVCISNVTFFEKVLHPLRENDYKVLLQLLKLLHRVHCELQIAQIPIESLN